MFKFSRSVGMLSLCFGFLLSTQVDVNAQSFVYTQGNTTAPVPLSTDLLQTSATVSTFSGSFNNESTGGIPYLTNGDAANGNANKAAIGNGSSITYTFDLSVNQYGYNISLLDIYSGWVDDGRPNPNVDVSYALFSDPSTFIFLDNASFSTAGGPNPWIKSSFTTSGLIASGVVAIKFDFGLQQNGYVGYAEFDVDGTPAPQPTPASVTVTGTANIIDTYEQTTSISGIVGPEGASQSLNFTVDPSSIATISGTGIVTPLKNGVVTITAASASVSSVTGTFVVSISGQAPDMVVLSAPGLSTTGDDIQFTAIITPSEADQNITWSVSDPTIGIINSVTGLFTPLAAGTVSVAGTSLLNSAIQGIALVNVPVIAASSAMIQSSSNQISGYAGNVTITSSVLPVNATYHDILLTLISPTLAGVSMNTATGVLSTDGSANGVVTVLGTYPHNLLVISPLVISISGQNAASIALSPAELTLTGATAYFMADITPANADQEVIWSVSDPLLASINSITGVITPAGFGVVTVTATAVKGGATGNAVLYLPAASLTSATVTLSSIMTGESALATVSYAPLNASAPITVLWSSSDNFIASVDANGSVTGMNEGFVTITATVYNAISTVTGSAGIFITTPIIFVPQNDVTVTGATNLTVGGTATYTATLTNTIAGTVITAWSVSQTAFAQIDEMGVLTATGPGMVTVSATVINGTLSFTGTLQLTVFAAPSAPSDTTIAEPTITGISLEEKTIPVTLYPNPATGHVFAIGTDVSELVFINAQGTVVYKQANANSADVSHLPRGLYTVVIKTPEEKIYKKLVLY